MSQPWCPSFASLAMQKHRSTCRALAAGNSVRQYPEPRPRRAPWSCPAMRRNTACRSWTHDTLKICRRVFGHVDERVHRTLEAFLARLNVRGLLSRNIHRHKGVEVNIGVDRDSVRLLFGDGRGRLRQRGRGNRRAKAEGQCQLSEFLETYRILLFWFVDCVVVARGSLQLGFFSTGGFYGPCGIEGASAALLQGRPPWLARKYDSIRRCA